MKSGNFVDRDIIVLREHYQSQIRTYDLKTDAIPICGKKVRFAPFPLFHGIVRAWLPEDFMVMPEYIARVRYITEYRAPVILTNDRYDENFCFHLLRTEAFQDPVSLDLFIQQMEDTILFQAPETVVYERGTIGTGDVDGRWFEYKSFTIDEETYNLQFLISSQGYLLAGTFNCRMKFYDEWKRIVLESLEYMEIGERKE